MFKRIFAGDWSPQKLPASLWTDELGQTDIASYTGQTRSKW